MQSTDYNFNESIKGKAYKVVNLAPCLPDADTLKEQFT